MWTDDLLALEQSAESPIRAVGATGFLTVTSEAAFTPYGPMSESGYRQISTRVVPRKLSFRLLSEETEAFLFARDQSTGGIFKP